MTGVDNPAATGGTALIASIAIQWLKNSKWATWFNRDTNRANLFLSVLIAFVSAIGIHCAWDSAAGTLLISGLTVAGIQHGVWEWIIQWAAQHASYKGFVVPSETLGEIRALLQRELPPPISTPERKTEEGKP